MEILAFIAITKIQSAMLVALGLGLVIFFHELGHFAVAKWCNVYVENFSIGFGPALLSWRWGETEYSLRIIPFGGYVKMLGQDDADPSQLTSEDLAKDPRSYTNKTVPQRMAIISAGVIMNIITGSIFFASAYLIGLQIAPPVIGAVDPGSPAWIAGLRRGDSIQMVNDMEVSGFAEVGLRVALSEKDVRVQGTHADGTLFDTTIAPDVSGTRPTIGVSQMNSLTLLNDPQGRVPPTVPGLSAERATPPLLPGDQFVKVDGIEIKTFTELQDQLATQAADEIVAQIRRKGENGEQLIDITIPPNYFRSLGLYADSGPITAIRKGSAAEAVGLKVGDKIAKVDGQDVGTQLDPFRLPDLLSSKAGQGVEIVVSRQIAGGGQATETLTVRPEKRAAWWEAPNADGGPLSVPALGAAFHIVPRVMHVVPEGPADVAKIPANAIIRKLELVRVGENKDLIDKEIFEIPLDDEKKANNWAYAFWTMQQVPQREIRLTYSLDGKLETATIKPELDESWPMPMRGLRTEELLIKQQAASVPEAFKMAFNNTRNSALNIYQTLRSLVKLRLSPKELHGPLSIPVVAYKIAQQGSAYLLSFLGFLSINLAVLNFLPIPVLDGGHMVFLLWEGITRKRPSEKVLIGASMAGLAVIGCLMISVLFLDIFVHKFWMLTSR